MKRTSYKMCPNYTKHRIFSKVKDWLSINKKAGLNEFNPAIFGAYVFISRVFELFGMKLTKDQPSKFLYFPVYLTYLLKGLHS